LFVDRRLNGVEDLRRLADDRSTGSEAGFAQTADLRE
jgi:hypothetical protein